MRFTARPIDVHNEIRMQHAPVIAQAVVFMEFSLRLKWARGLVMKPAALAAQNVGGALESLVGLGSNSFVSTYVRF